MKEPTFSLRKRGFFAMRNPLFSTPLVLLLLLIQGFIYFYSILPIIYQNVQTCSFSLAQSEKNVYLCTASEKK